MFVDLNSTGSILELRWLKSGYMQCSKEVQYIMRNVLLCDSRCFTVMCVTG